MRELRCFLRGHRRSFRIERTAGVCREVLHLAAARTQWDARVVQCSVTMSRGRLEAFSDGVMAVLITIMVLELHIPEGNGLEALRAVLPQFLFYVMSFIYLGIYWSNHHHLLHTVSTVNGKILWANLHLLFWLSLFPVTTAWMGENHLAVIPTATYGVVMICAAIAYTILVRTIIATHGRQSTLATAVGRAS